MRSFREKPVGWRGESHRHYLSAKGIKTSYKQKRYMALFDELEVKRVGDKYMIYDNNLNEFFIGY